MLDEGDLVGLADLLNEQFGTRVAEVDAQGIRAVPGAADSDLAQFRRQVREDPAGALELVRGPPLDGVDAPWAAPMRAQIQTEIVAAAHAACRLDPANAAEYLRMGLRGAPGNASLWIALLGVAGRAKSMQAVEIVYGWACDTYTTAGPGTVPTDIQREYARWRRELPSG
jgi:hypothetical protein